MSTTTYSDQSTEKPGVMGWGLDSQTDQQRYNSEAKTLDVMASAMPSCAFERRARDIPDDSPIMQQVKTLQASDGIEDGFAFHYLERAVFGAMIVWLAQTIGSCVASGAMRGVFGRTLAEILIWGKAAEFFGKSKPDVSDASNMAIFAPYSYGEGRQIGGIDSGGDGSFCGAHIQGFMQGMLPCWAQGLDKFTDQYPEPLRSESIYRKWGDKSYRSVRSQFKTIAADFKLTESTKVQSADKGIEFLTKHLKPMMICSTWGFAPAGKIPGTEWWIYKRSGTWAHNMTIYGALKILGNWYIVVKNSWGMTAHKNGDFFLVPAELWDQWLKSAECQTIGELTLPESMPAA